MKFACIECGVSYEAGVQGRLNLLYYHLNSLNIVVKLAIWNSVCPGTLDSCSNLLFHSFFFPKRWCYFTVEEHAKFSCAFQIVLWFKGWSKVTASFFLYVSLFSKQLFLKFHVSIFISIRYLYFTVLLLINYSFSITCQSINSIDSFEVSYFDVASSNFKNPSQCFGFLCHKIQIKNCNNLPYCSSFGVLYFCLM